MKRTLITRLAAFLACLCLVPAAAADPTATWPDRPVRFVVTAGAGGASDTLARAIAERLSAAWKQPVLVENRPGANGMIATKAVMGAPADGYTLLYSNASSTVMLTALKPQLGFDANKDLAPVVLTAVGGILLAVNPEVPARTLQELVGLVKSNPDRYMYASWGVGSNGHLTMEWLKQQADLRIGHVPYKSIPSILTELSSGIVKVAWVDIVSSLPFIQSGRIRPIAVSGSTRTPKLPDVPTMGEQGYAFPAVGWQAVFAPTGTPPAVVARIHDAINQVQSQEEMKSLMTRLNLDPPPLWSVEKFRELLDHDVAVWRKIVRDADIKVE